MKSKIETALLVLLLCGLLAVVLSPTLRAEPVERRGGEILWQKGKSTLYRCGPGDEDICLNDGYRVTKVYVGP